MWIHILTCYSNKFSWWLHMRFSSSPFAGGCGQARFPPWCLSTPRSGRTGWFLRRRLGSPPPPPAPRSAGCRMWPTCLQCENTRDKISTIASWHARCAAKTSSAQLFAGQDCIHKKINKTTTLKEAMELWGFILWYAMATIQGYLYKMAFYLLRGLGVGIFNLMEIPKKKYQT